MSADSSHSEGLMQSIQLNLLTDYEVNFTQDETNPTLIHIHPINPVVKSFGRSYKLSCISNEVRVQHPE